MFISTFVEFSKLTMQKSCFRLFVTDHLQGLQSISQFVSNKKKQKKQHTKNKKVLYSVYLGLVDA